ncbi:CvpA family protein [Rhizorhabdus dicambivorans]|uniref:Colicin V production protein n=1 Tax=Rhizorhabdus dicambivorans TaxID=1850238 RepID=A0A2A4FWP1_9SPHN|nr:CvpA family protein [Rhizorhabdus dicambivorans]ATE64104.1 colicin V production protein [Rhizorhabdus dicambivorans]PCE42623.1 colicin V production protein [Rhizorhabdus dicambivorans]
MHGLTGLDIIVLLAIFGGGIFGMMRGFVTEVIALFAWVAAIVALKLFHEPATKLLFHVVGNPSGASVLAFALVFLIVYAGGKLVAASLGQRTRSSVLGPLDRVLGFGFGALKGLIVVTLAYLLINLGYDTLYGVTAERPNWMRQSRTHPLLNATGRAVIDWIGKYRKQGGLIGGEAKAEAETKGDGKAKTAE